METNTFAEEFDEPSEEELVDEFSKVAIKQKKRDKKKIDIEEDHHVDQDVKAKYSAYWLTINLNYYPSVVEFERCRDIFLKSLEDIVSKNYYPNDQRVGKTKFTEGKFVPPFLMHKDKQGQLLPHQIKDIKAKVGCEVSAKGALHGHVLLDITHTSFIMIDCEFIRANFCKFMLANGFQKVKDDIAFSDYRVYSHVKHVKSNESNRSKLLRYMTKSDSHTNWIDSNIN